MSTPETYKFNLELRRKVQASAETLRRALQITPQTQITAGIVLGSGLGLYCDVLTDVREVPFDEIPNLPASAVPGHAGTWVLGKTPQGQNVIVQKGRIHAYEGHDATIVTLPIRILRELGLNNLILTNAAGSLNPTYAPGDFVFLDDHINFTGSTPLRGIFSEELGPRFVDLSQTYNREWNKKLSELVQNSNRKIKTHRGVYFGVNGPNYETPAEVRMMGKLGGDVVGMSTVHEAIVAKQCGLNVLGISCVTNLGCGLSDQPLAHEEVADMAKKSAPDFVWLVNEAVGMMNA